jgi:hypothetical protein
MADLILKELVRALKRTIPASIISSHFFSASFQVKSTSRLRVRESPSVQKLSTHSTAAGSPPSLCHLQEKEMRQRERSKKGKLPIVASVRKETWQETLQIQRLMNTINNAEQLCAIETYQYGC